MKGTFRGQVVIVTGASSGIGRGLCQSLARQGAKLALAARSRAGLEETAALCHQLGSETIIVPTDVSDVRQCGELVDQTASRWGRVDMLIANAGVSTLAFVAELPDATLIEHVMKVNFLGSVYCVHAALPHLTRTKGRIIVVSSLGAFLQGPGSAAYLASKHAQRGFFDSLRTELRDDGVSVTIAYPGFVATDIFDRFLGLDGRPRENVRPLIPETTLMPVSTCADRIVRAAARRKRDVIPVWWGKPVASFHYHFPGLADLLWARFHRQARRHLNAGALNSPPDAAPGG